MNYSDYITNQLNKTVSYSEYVAEKNYFSYSDYINENIDDILFSIEKWVLYQPWKKTPNQVDDKYYTIDIGCSTDVPLMRKQYDWQKVFDYFNNHPKLKTTFATKV